MIIHIICSGAQGCSQGPGTKVRVPGLQSWAPEVLVSTYLLFYLDTTFPAFGQFTVSCFMLETFKVADLLIMVTTT